MGSGLGQFRLNNKKLVFAVSLMGTPHEGARTKATERCFGDLALKEDIIIISSNETCSCHNIGECSFGVKRQLNTSDSSKIISSFDIDITTFNYMHIFICR